MSSSGQPVVAIYPGSFDPVTRGHEDIVHRTLRVVDHLVVAVAHTATHAKKSLFTVEERVDLLRRVLPVSERLEIASFQGLLVDYARARGARAIVRGLRAVSDFEYELQMAQMNRELSPEMETLFLAPEARFSFLSSSLVREIAALHGDVSPFVSSPVLAALREKFGGS
ncbi:MAG: pantetheine-phosphate adenylyltransferase [Gemmatimonadota bacterium]